MRGVPRASSHVFGGIGSRIRGLGDISKKREQFFGIGIFGSGGSWGVRGAQSGPRGPRTGPYWDQGAPDGPKPGPRGAQEPKPRPRALATWSLT